MWHVGTWLSDGLGSAGEFFDSMVWEGFSNLNNSVITRMSNCIPVSVFEALRDWKMLLESRSHICHSKQGLTPPNTSLVVVWVAFSGWDFQWLLRLLKETDFSYWQSFPVDNFHLLLVLFLMSTRTIVLFSLCISSFCIGSLFSSTLHKMLSEINQF